uniref:Uncharacterized protein n=1 Tax=Globisporangium ultimum (strain ATCC 200006 / CBS 805.95 / DAOM BR144) TaxID=431595 RepID=K3WQ67_GLOUD
MAVTTSDATKIPAASEASETKPVKTSSKSAVPPPPFMMPQLCRYAGKKCTNARSFKRNGSLHNLCHYHRVRANQNQRRMELRRRIKRVHDSKVMTPPPAYFAHAPLSPVDAMQWVDHTLHYDTTWMVPPPQAPVHFSAPPPPQDSLLELFAVTTAPFGYDTMGYPIGNSLPFHGIATKTEPYGFGVVHMAAMPPVLVEMPLLFECPDLHEQRLCADTVDAFYF